MTDRSSRRAGALMLAPALTVLAAVTAYPVLAVLWLSLQRRVPVFGISEFVGLAHYRFLSTDPAFWAAVRVTAVFVLVSVVIEVSLGVIVALGLRRQRRFRTVTLALLLLPWCVPGVVTARAFEWLYHPTSGLVNALLGGAGLNWLGDPSLALSAVIVADVWRTMPFVALLCLARLVAIPDEVYEAAAVDGASALAQLRWITLPLLVPVLTIAGLFRTLDALRAFDLMYVLTGGGPAAATETLTVLAYRQLFQTLQLGFGAAVASIVFVLVVAIAWGYSRSLRATEAPA